MIMLRYVNILVLVRLHCLSMLEFCNFFFLCVCVCVTRDVMPFYMSITFLGICW